MCIHIWILVQNFVCFLKKSHFTEFFSHLAHHLTIGVGDLHLLTQIRTCSSTPRSCRRLQWDLWCGHLVASITVSLWGDTNYCVYNKLQRYSVQHRECNQYLIITWMDITFQNRESLYCTPVTFVILYATILYLESDSFVDTCRWLSHFCFELWGCSDSLPYSSWPYMLLLLLQKHWEMQQLG